MQEETRPPNPLSGEPMPEVIPPPVKPVIEPPPPPPVKPKYGLQLPSKVKVTDLLAAIKTIKWKRDDTGIFMAFNPSAGVDAGLLESPAFVAVLKEISTLRGAAVVNIMINKIPPGVSAPVHRDWVKPIKGIVNPTVERWHLPILTNDKALWWDEKLGSEGAIMPVGMWSGPVEYWLHHTVKNLGSTDRIHIVVDLERFVEARYAK